MRAYEQIFRTTAVKIKMMFKFLRNIYTPEELWSEVYFLLWMNEITE